MFSFCPALIGCTHSSGRSFLNGIGSWRAVSSDTICNVEKFLQETQPGCVPWPVSSNHIWGVVIKSVRNSAGLSAHTRNIISKKQHSQYTCTFPAASVHVSSVVSVAVTLSVPSTASIAQIQDSTWKYQTFTVEISVCGLLSRHTSQVASYVHLDRQRLWQTVWVRFSGSIVQQHKKYLLILTKRYRPRYPCFG